MVKISRNFSSKGLICFCILSNKASSMSQTCYKSKTCIHDNVEKCGVSSSGTPRLFLDSCDIYEYNCKKNTDFTRSPTTEPCKDLPSLYNVNLEQEAPKNILESDADAAKDSEPNFSHQSDFNNDGDDERDQDYSTKNSVQEDKDYNSTHTQNDPDGDQTDISFGLKEDTDYFRDKVYSDEEDNKHKSDQNDNSENTELNDKDIDETDVDLDLVENKSGNRSDSQVNDEVSNQDSGEH